MSALEAFELAVNAGAPSGFFHTTLFLVPLERSEHPAAKRALAERIASAQAAGPSVVAQLVRAGELAAKLGFPSGAPPRVADEYFPWFARLDARFSGAEGYASGRHLGEASGSLYFLNEALIVAYQLQATKALAPQLTPLLDSLDRIASHLPESEAREALVDLGDYDWLDEDSGQPLSERLAPVRTAYDAVRRRIEQVLSDGGPRTRTS